MPVEELLELLQGDALELVHLGSMAGQGQGVSRDDVWRYVAGTLEPALRSGLIRPFHFFGSAAPEYLRDDLTVEEVMDLARYTIDASADPSFSALDHDFWFEATEAGHAWWRANHQDSAETET